MPTNLESALAKNLRIKKDESALTQTVMLGCFAICLANLLLIFESPAFAVAVMWTAR
jgi:hypothetical protein